MKPSGGSVDEFVAAIPSVTRQRDAITLIEMMREISGREPELWGTIIGFGSVHYVYPTGTSGDMPILGFSPRKPSSTVYLLDAAAETEGLDELGPHTVSKACLYLKDLSKNDHTVLRRILQDSYDKTISEQTDYGTLTVTA